MDKQQLSLFDIPEPTLKRRQQKLEMSREQFIHLIDNAVPLLLYPEDVRFREPMEYALIKKWRSPFNKENRAQWSHPFGD